MLSDSENSPGQINILNTRHKKSANELRVLMGRLFYIPGTSI